jgi:hypothetical protein
MVVADAVSHASSEELKRYLSFNTHDKIKSKFTHKCLPPSLHAANIIVLAKTLDVGGDATG